MKALNQYELEKVSGGSVLGTVAAVIAIGAAAYDFGKGVYQGWND